MSQQSLQQLLKCLFACVYWLAITPNWFEIKATKNCYQCQSDTTLHANRSISVHLEIIFLPIYLFVFYLILTTLNEMSLSNCASRWLRTLRFRIRIQKWLFFRWNVLYWIFRNQHLWSRNIWKKTTSNNLLRCFEMLGSGFFPNAMQKMQRICFETIFCCYWCNFRKIFLDSNKHHQPFEHIV